ncbi:MAG: helix-turn-helix domain-containing protein [archaeon]
MELEKLKKIGLTDGELNVYETLLTHGESTKTNLSKLSKVSPSKIYDVAQRLIQKGIISSVKKQGVAHFKASKPERLLDLINEKEKEISKEKEIVKDLLPTLTKKYDTQESEIDINTFYGWNGLKTAFLTLENSMGKEDVSEVFGASIGLDPNQGDIFWKQHQSRVEKRKFKVRIIFNEDMKKEAPQRHEYYDNHPLHQIKYLHQKTLNEFYIYNDYVLILISLKTPIAILIKNKETVKAYRQFFKSLWNQAKK